MIDQDDWVMTFTCSWKVTKIFSYAISRLKPVKIERNQSCPHILYYLCQVCRSQFTEAYRGLGWIPVQEKIKLNPPKLKNGWWKFFFYMHKIKKQAQNEIILKFKKIS